MLNTPSHHRVHHGANVEYLDRNRAGILVVWDRLFGTFEPERARESRWVILTASQMRARIRVNICNQRIILGQSRDLREIHAAP